MDFVMESASGAHFSGLRIDGLLAASTSSPRFSPSAASVSDTGSSKQPLVIGVSGGTASGKTTVCDMIFLQLHGHRVVLVNQFVPGNPSEVLITSADSRIRILDGSEVIHKFRGFRNTSNQIAASFTADGKYIICASEDSQVYVWKRDKIRHTNAGGGKGKGLITTTSHEHFLCRDVSVAISWPRSITGEPPTVPLHSKRHQKRSSTHHLCVMRLQLQMRSPAVKGILHVLQRVLV